jgi:phosphoribosylglycinamide formyltransferase-1
MAFLSHYVHVCCNTWLDTEKFSAGWWLLKIGVLLIGYQIFILAFGFCFGQFSFFWKFEKKILARFGLIRKPVKNTVTSLAIFASGAGSNARNIIEHFRNHPYIKVQLIVCNKPGAGVISIAEKNSVPVMLITRNDISDGNALLLKLKNEGIDYIILAGFLLKLPAEVVDAFPKKIINIHPALLPKYGGHGMYGSRVHEAVINNKEKKSGITIHYVDEIYDNGEIIFQSHCNILGDDTPSSLAEKIHALEHQHYPAIVQSVIEKQNRG